MLVENETQLKEKHVKSLGINQLQLKNLLDTIGYSYIKGVNDADSAWRKAVSEFLEENNIPQAKMCHIYSKLNPL